MQPVGLTGLKKKALRAESALGCEVAGELATPYVVGMQPCSHLGVLFLASWAPSFAKKNPPKKSLQMLPPADQVVLNICKKL